MLAGLAKSSTGSSNRVCRFIVADEPPSLDAGEITDKGTINKRAVLRRGSELIEALYATPLPEHVIICSRNS